jgi:hypothetical protein
MDWGFDWGTQKSSINLGRIFALEKLWFWSVAIAHRLLPVTLVIDQEGALAEFCAEWDSVDDDRIRLTLGHTTYDNIEYERHVWCDDRARWLRRLGYLFDQRLNAGLDSQEWLGLSPLWLEAARFLSWQWPGLIAHWTESDWPQPRLQAWFFAMLASIPAPLGDPFQGPGVGSEIFARLRARFVDLRLEAVAGFYRSLEHDSAELIESERLICSPLRDLLKEKDAPSPALGSPEFEQTEKNLPPNLQRHHRLLRAYAEFDDVLHGKLRKMVETVRIFPLQPGMWIRDHLARPGRVLEFREGFGIVDWGDEGFRREYGLLGAWQANAWRWPVKEAEDFESPDRPMLHRWRTLALAKQTWDLIVCSCCGYPHLDDIDEIFDCPICAWPLYLALHGPLFRPELPLALQAGDKFKNFPTLAESRQYFEVHADAFPADDRMHTSWIRRADIAALRQKVCATFDQWLLVADEGTPLPRLHWEELAWMPKDDDHGE